MIGFGCAWWLKLNLGSWRSNDGGVHGGAHNEGCQLLIWVVMELC